MTATPVPNHAPINPGPLPRPGRTARWAVVLAAVVAAVIAVSWAIVGVAYAVGGDDAISDNWVGFLGVVALFGGLLGSLVALVLAVVAKARHERAPRTWLPLSLFPALVVIVVLAEAFWLE